MTWANSMDEKTVSFRVFLSDEERTKFKTECARSKTNMNQKVRELINQWLEQLQTPALASTGVRDVKDDKERSPND